MCDLPSNAPSPRLCHIVKWPEFEGYGFNLHAEKARAGQYIGKVDENSPADLAGLKEGDRIVEVNGVNISNENHKQVVERIKSMTNETKLLVIDSEGDAWYKDHNELVRGDQPNIIYGNSKRSSSPENSAPEENGSRAESTSDSRPESINESRPDSTEAHPHEDDRKSVGSSSCQSENSNQAQPIPVASDNESATTKEPIPSIMIETADSDSGEGGQDKDAPDSATDAKCTDNPSTDPECTDNTSTDPVSSDQVCTNPSATAPEGTDAESKEPIVEDVCTDQTASMETAVAGETTPTEQSVDTPSETPSTETPSTENDPSFLEYDNVRFTEEKGSAARPSSASPPSTPKEKDRRSLSSSISGASCEETKGGTETPPPEEALRKSPMSTTPSPPPSINPDGSLNNNQNSTTTVNSTTSSMSGLNLNMTAAEMRAQLAAKKKFDPRKDQIDLKKKYQIIQNM